MNVHFSCPLGSSHLALLASLISGVFYGNEEACQAFVKDVEIFVNDASADSMANVSLEASKSSIAGEEIISLTLLVNNQQDYSSHSFKVPEIPGIIRRIDTQKLPTKMQDLAIKITNWLDSARDPQQPTDITLDEFVALLGFVYCINKLSITSISYDPLPLGGGTAKSEDGSSSQIPSPLILKLLKGMAISTAENPDLMNIELLSPMAVTMLKVAARVFPKTAADSLTLTSFGYGAASRLPSQSVRATFFESLHDDTFTNTASMVEPTAATTTYVEDPDLWMTDSLMHMETNLDDTTGEHLAHVIEMLLKNGAADAWATPIVMKKGRPAHTLHCLCASNGTLEDVTRQKELLECMFRHTTTLGIRIQDDLARAKLDRSFVTVATPYKDKKRQGQVEVKLGKFQNGDLVSVKAEFDHCKDISEGTGVPIKTISDCAVQKAREEYKLM